MRRQFGSLALTAMTLVVLASTLWAQQGQKYAVPYPRAGVLKLGENDRVIAWEVLRDKGAGSPMYRLPLDQVW